MIYLRQREKMIAGDATLYSLFAFYLQKYCQPCHPCVGLLALTSLSHSRKRRHQESDQELLLTF